MYLEYEDFETLCDTSDLEVITGESPEKRERALKFALDEVRSYMRTKYRIDQEFAKTGDARNEYLMMIVADITLYHLYSMLPSRMSLETREARYKSAIKWLEGVRDSKQHPGIPSNDDPIETGTDPVTSPEYYDGLRFGSMTKNNNDW